MYHILKRVDYGERTYSVYHNSSTHTLEEAQMILDELNKLSSNRPNDEDSDITDSYILAKDYPTIFTQNPLRK